MSNRLSMPLLSVVQNTGSRIWLIQLGAYDLNKVTALTIINVTVWTLLCTKINFEINQIFHTGQLLDYWHAVEGRWCIDRLRVERYRRRAKRDVRTHLPVVTVLFEVYDLSKCTLIPFYLINILFQTEILFRPFSKRTPSDSKAFILSIRCQYLKCCLRYC